ncbi:hypothetical protein D3C74_393320 [compost metagenome]
MEWSIPALVAAFDFKEENIGICKAGETKDFAKSLGEYMEIHKNSKTSELLAIEEFMDSVFDVMRQDNASGTEKVE